MQNNKSSILYTHVQVVFVFFIAWVAYTAIIIYDDRYKRGHSSIAAGAQSVVWKNDR